MPGTILSQFGTNTDTIKAHVPVIMVSTLSAISSRLGKRIFHPYMSHCNAVADADGRNHDWCASCHSDTSLNSFGNLVKMHVTRNDLAVCRNNCNQWFVLILLQCIAHCVEEASHGSLFYTFCNEFTSWLIHNSNRLLFL